MSFNDTYKLYSDKLIMIITANMSETPEVGGQRGHVLGYQLTIFRPRGTDYACHTTTGPPIFLDDAASLCNIVINFYESSNYESNEI